MNKKLTFLNTGILLGASLFLNSTQAKDNQITAPETQLSYTSSVISSAGVKNVRHDTLDPSDVLFIFADLHPDLIASSNTMTPSALAANAGGLAKVAHAIKAPSLFLTVPRNGKPGELLPELQPYATAENTIYRENADPFRVKQIVDAIKKSGKHTLIVSGYTSEVAVMLTALGALDNGYRVMIPVDCIGNRSARTEDAALARTAQAGAQITSLASVAAQLAPDFSKEPGTTILSVILDAKL
ncbi:isochorismatase family protein [Cronobacter dublinensis]|uniref:isochorismatase family protein n=1 Tax=Cronobacter dublinensis TaxID=413497 RepID=UPI002A475EAC|nr:isochorismatase family protein [Cronobacter dublinensis subsp. dublinensis]ELY9424906.1 isochorismatase family protein [Cronobacter dublinensis]EGT5679590.1 isochorismatase family protein [Cronobacter dublinensis subsp. dublinensis]EGT5688123.1 isochorismatase family protein [Cronobacter dublinensis subsp. dublinensis]EGT5691834.1 isochorismatase family protein [Cronobacter dublinensis subsp. dublinensis]